jgi:hypothetical protein
VAADGGWPMPNGCLGTSLADDLLQRKSLGALTFEDPDGWRVVLVPTRVF